MAVTKPLNLEQMSKEEQNLNELQTSDFIKRLRSIPRFNLATYRIGDFETETERQTDENGDYIDSYEIDDIIRELTNSL